MSGVPLDRLVRIHNRVLVFLACTLSCTIVLKIASIQYLELIFAADFVLLLWLFARSGLQARVFRPFYSIGRSYAIFMAVAFLLALVALRQPFDTTGAPLLQRPLLVTISRMVELFLDVFYMLYLATIMKADEALAKFGIKTYFWTGIAGGIYSFIGLAVSIVSGGSPLEYRFQGFLNEGGPYGVYLLSLCAVSLAMRKRGWLSARQFGCGVLFFAVCLLGSRSKAAIFALAILGLVYLVWMLHGWKRLTLLAGFAAVLTFGAINLDLPGQLLRYTEAVAVYRELSNLHSDDPNLVKGRVAGAVLAPRMIREHPLAGIGWGNYALVRDLPEYRQGAAFAPKFGDAPSLGVIDYIADLGFPLWIYLMWIEVKPLYFLRRRGADPRLVALAAMQPIANICGAHLNMTYQWIAVALAMGVGFGTPGEEENRA